MTYRLIIVETEWRIMRDGREIMGGTVDSLEDGRAACVELNKEASHATLR